MGLKQYFVALVAGLALFYPLTPAFCQNSPDLKLDLKGEKRAEPRDGGNGPLGEFRISLGSQVLGAEFSNDNQSRFQFLPSPVPVGNMTLQRPTLDNFDPRPRFSPENPADTGFPRHERRELGSTLTLTASYFQDQFGRLSAVPRTIGAGKRIGRWAVYGELEQNTPTLVRMSDKSNNLIPVKPPLMNVTASQNRPPERSEVKSPAPSEENLFSALKNYSLEAIYNFHPLFKGKLSYKRSQADILETKENLQLEGIVEPGKDMLIKAGYENKTTPELRERKVPGDTKVWTEFIFKF